MPPTTFSEITDHVYWMSAGQPDRAALGLIKGERYNLMLDAGASREHIELFLAALQHHGLALPRFCVLTHWHWDHVFGAATLDMPLIAHKQTAAELRIQAQYTWDDAALDARVANGSEIAFCADNIKLELPSPRTVEIRLPDVEFEADLTFDMGDVTCTVQHVGGDHAADSCIMVADRVVFLGDCLYDAIYTPKRHYTREKLFPVLDKILSYDADYYIEGHNTDLLIRAELDAMASDMRLAGDLVTQYGDDKLAIQAAAEGQQTSDDFDYFVSAFIAGLAL